MLHLLQEPLKYNDLHAASRLLKESANVISSKCNEDLVVLMENRTKFQQSGCSVPLYSLHFSELSYKSRLSWARVSLSGAWALINFIQILEYLSNMFIFLANLVTY